LVYKQNNQVKRNGNYREKKNSCNDPKRRTIKKVYYRVIFQKFIKIGEAGGVSGI
jgi:hypothetical protein